MVRRLEYTIPSEYEGKTIEAFLRSKEYPSRILTILRHTRDSVCLQGQPVYLKTRAEAGMELVITLAEENISTKVIPVQLPFSIVYEDEDLLVANKPAFMPSHPSMQNRENTLGNAAAYYFESRGESIPCRIVNRLDKNTSGLTILAKNRLSDGILYGEIQKHQIRRDYFAIVEGEDLPDEGRIDLPIARSEDSVLMRTTDPKHGQRAITHYRVLQRQEGLALVQCRLETGRTHQIRVHMQAIGHPLIGDHLYNPKNHIMNRQALHAGFLSFRHPITGEDLLFAAELPEDMQGIFDYNISERRDLLCWNYKKEDQ